MNVTIRPLLLSDAYTSVKWRNDSEVFKYTGNTYDHLITIESELEWIQNVLANKDEYRCAILVDQKYVGNIYLTNIQDSRAKYHIFIGEKSYWGKGVAKQASQLILNDAKEKFSLSAVMLKVRKDNENALKLYQSLGFQINEEIDNWLVMQIDL